MFSASWSDNIDTTTLNTFDILNMSTKNMLNNMRYTNESLVKFEHRPILPPTHQQQHHHQQQQQQQQSQNRKQRSPKKMASVKRGFSAKRYLRNLTKHWDQKLLDTFITNGKINAATIYESNERMNKRRRLSDELSMWPTAYKFDKSWISATIDMKTYRFIKANRLDSAVYERSDSY